MVVMNDVDYEEMDEDDMEQLTFDLETLEGIYPYLSDDRKREIAPTILQLLPFPEKPHFLQQVAEELGGDFARSIGMAQIQLTAGPLIAVVLAFLAVLTVYNAVMAAP